LDESDPLNAKRIKELNEQIEYGEGQSNALQTRLDEIHTQVDKLNNAKYQKEQEAEAQRIAQENEAARLQKQEDVKGAENALTDISTQISFFESRLLSDNADTAAAADLALNGDLTTGGDEMGLYAIKADIEKHISNAKGELARADEEAKKAAAIKAEMQILAGLQTEYDRLSNLFLPL
jgi:hypothetical protein